MHKRYLTLTIALLACAALFIVGCSQGINSAPSDTLTPSTTAVTQPVTTTTQAPTTTTTQAPPITVVSAIDSERAWLQEIAKPMCGFVWMLTNFDLVASQLEPYEVQWAMEQMVGIVQSYPAPTARCQSLADQFTDIVAPWWVAVQAIDAGDQATYEQAMSVIQSVEYQRKAEQFGYNLGVIADDCGMGGTVIDWMTNGVSEYTGA